MYPDTYFSMYDPGARSDLAELWPMFLVIGLIYLVVCVAWLVLQIVAWWKIFTKAGEKGWKCLIPFYSQYTQFKITWDTLYFWLMIALVITFVVLMPAAILIGGAAGVLLGLLAVVAYVAAFVVGITATHRLSQAFGHGVGFTLGLLFLQPIFILILGLGGDQYQGNPYARRI